MNETPFFEEIRASFIASLDATVPEALLAIASDKLDLIVERLAFGEVFALDDEALREVLQIVDLDYRIPDLATSTVRGLAKQIVRDNLIQLGHKLLQQRRPRFTPAPQVFVPSRGKTIAEILEVEHGKEWLVFMLKPTQPRRDPNHAEHDIFLAAENVAATHFLELLPSKRGDK